ncbi:hypothetical protein ACWD48_28170 [Streptomyces sp. NPDC002519]
MTFHDPRLAGLATGRVGSDFTFDQQKQQAIDVEAARLRERRQPPAEKAALFH